MSDQTNFDPITGASRTPGKEKQKTSPTSSSSKIRNRRADEYEIQGLKNPKAFEACLAAIQADQIRIGFVLGDAVKRMLADLGNSPDKLSDLEPSMSIYLRVTRQIERYCQLEIRQAELDQIASEMAAGATAGKGRSDPPQEEARTSKPK